MVNPNKRQATPDGRIWSAPLHLYIHIPFCLHKCAYCDFNSHVRPEIPWQSYLQASLHELKHWAAQDQFAGQKINTIYIGGGTPSLAPPEHIAELLEQAESLFGFEDGIEISMETNPGAVDASHLAGYRAAGVNRLSIGVQSFDDRELHWLERIHNARDAEDTFRSARHAGFTNINLDLMYGLPGQSIKAWNRSLEQATHLQPEHLSCYQLTVEKHTELASRHAASPLALPDDENALAFLHATRQQLDMAGYSAYEISNFSLPGFECRHNDGYWLYHDYIGIGAGASGKWDASDNRVRRYSNIRSPEGYMKAACHHGNALGSEESLMPGKAAAEAVWLGLRRTSGISRPWFSHRFEQDVWEMFGQVLSPWQSAGCLELNPEQLRLTAKGAGLADAVAADVLATGHV